MHFRGKVMLISCPSYPRTSSWILFFFLIYYWKHLRLSWMTQPAVLALWSSPFWRFASQPQQASCRQGPMSAKSDTGRDLLCDYNRECIAQNQQGNRPLYQLYYPFSRAKLLLDLSIIPTVIGMQHWNIICITIYFCGSIFFLFANPFILTEAMHQKKSTLRRSSRGKQKRQVWWPGRGQEESKRKVDL